MPALGMVAAVRRCGSCSQEGGDFQARVCRAIRALGPGEIATYGEIAGEAGFPGAARAVGHFLARDEHEVPWWRVVTSTGRLVPGEERRHAALLRAEGVEVRKGRVARRGPAGR